MLFEGKTEIVFEVQPEAWGYKVYCYSSPLANRLNRIAGYPYPRGTDFVAEGSEGIFKIKKELWPRAQRALAKFTSQK